MKNTLNLFFSVRYLPSRNCIQIINVIGLQLVTHSEFKLPNPKQHQQELQYLYMGMCSNNYIPAMIMKFVKWDKASLWPKKTS